MLVASESFVGAFQKAIVIEFVTGLSKVPGIMRKVDLSLKEMIMQKNSCFMLLLFLCTFFNGSKMNREL